MILDDDACERIARRDPDAHPFVPRPPGRNPQLQVISSDRERAVFERQRIVRDAHLVGVETIGESTANVTDATRALADNRTWRAAAERGRGGSRTIGIWKHVQVRERRALEMCGERLEVLVGLAREADDDVGSD